MDFTFYLSLVAQKFFPLDFYHNCSPFKLYTPVCFCNVIYIWQMKVKTVSTCAICDSGFIWKPCSTRPIAESLWPWVFGGLKCSCGLFSVPVFNGFFHGSRFRCSFFIEPELWKNNVEICKKSWTAKKLLTLKKTVLKPWKNLNRRKTTWPQTFSQPVWRFCFTFPGPFHLEVETQKAKKSPPAHLTCLLPLLLLYAFRKA